MIPPPIATLARNSTIAMTIEQDDESVKHAHLSVGPMKSGPASLARAVLRLPTKRRANLGARQPRGMITWVRRMLGIESVKVRTVPDGRFPRSSSALPL